MTANFLAFLIFSFVPFAGHGQDESELAHFQSFFSEKQHPPLETALHMAKLRLADAQEIQDPIEEAKALRSLGLIHLNRLHDYEKAMDLLTQALSIADSLDLESQQVLTYVGIARVFEVVGDYHKSAELLGLALTLNENDRDINSLAMILNNLGKVNAARGRIEDAFSNYEQVLKYREDISKQFEAEALFNLGHLYTLQSKYSKALETHKKA